MLQILSALASGFLQTLLLVALTFVIGLPLGVLVAIMRVSPVGVLRGVGTVYVNVFRNIPLPVLMFFSVLVLPQLGVDTSFFVLALASLVVYWGAFFCETVRSGINSVDLGQVEAARSVGLSSGQTLIRIVLPQALRSTVPPLIGIVIQIVRASAVAGAFGVTELYASMNGVIQHNADKVILILFLTGVFYLVITIPSGLLLGRIEKKAVFAR